MPAQITSGGYWLIESPKATGIVRYSTPGTVEAASGAVFLGSKSVSMTNLRKGITTLDAPGLYEVAGGLPQLIETAEKKGQALISETPSDAVWDPTLTAFAAGLGTVAAGASIAASGAVDAAAAGATDAAAEGTADAGADGAEDAANEGDGSGGSNLSKLLSDAAKLGTAGVLADFLGKLWHPLRILKLIAGLVVGYMGLKQLAAVAGVSTPSLPRAVPVPV